MTGVATRVGDKTDQYYELIAQRLGDRKRQRLRHQMDFQYRGIDFRGRTVLDIGGGNGVHSFYAAARGARQVVTLEPELDGSTAGVLAQFREWKRELGAAEVELVISTFQDYQPAAAQFDIVIIQDAINHLDEEACVTLGRVPESEARYRKIFRKLAEVASPGATLLFSDCSSQNLFPLLGRRNPFDPAIEWEKHQPPSRWIKMLEREGFALKSKRWSTPTSLGSGAQALLGNSLLTYFYTSHFVVQMTKR